MHLRVSEGGVADHLGDVCALVHGAPILGLRVRVSTHPLHGRSPPRWCLLAVPVTVARTAAAAAPLRGSPAPYVCRAAEGTPRATRTTCAACDGHAPRSRDRGRTAGRGRGGARPTRRQLPSSPPLSQRIFAPCTFPTPCSPEECPPLVHQPTRMTPLPRHRARCRLRPCTTPPNPIEPYLASAAAAASASSPTSLTLEVDQPTARPDAAPSCSAPVCSSPSHRHQVVCLLSTQQHCQHPLRSPANRERRSDTQKDRGKVGYSARHEKKSSS